MRSGVVKFIELILQLIGRQHHMVVGQLDLSLLKQEIEELVRFCDVKIIALFDSSSPRIWHHYCLLTPIPFSYGNLFFFIVLIVLTNWTWIISLSDCGTLLESGISTHTLELAIERCYSLRQLTQVVKFFSQQLFFHIGSIP